MCVELKNYRNGCNQAVNKLKFNYLQFDEVVTELVTVVTKSHNYIQINKLRVVTKNEQLVYLLLSNLILKKQLLESEKNIKEMNEIFEEKLGVQPIDFSEQQLHILSHQKIYAQFYVFNTFPKEISKDFIEINQDQIQDFPLPRLIDRYLESFVF